VGRVWVFDMTAETLDIRALEDEGELNRIDLDTNGLREALQQHSMINYLHGATAWDERTRQRAFALWKGWPVLTWKAEDRRQKALPRLAAEASQGGDYVVRVQHVPASVWHG
jgi:hypothetical protein